MPYTPTTWVDEVLASTPPKYKIETDSAVIAEDATITLTTTPTQAGTPINADRKSVV